MYIAQWIESFLLPNLHFFNNNVMSRIKCIQSIFYSCCWVNVEIKNTRAKKIASYSKNKEQPGNQSFSVLLGKWLDEILFRTLAREEITISYHPTKLSQKWKFLLLTLRSYLFWGNRMLFGPSAEDFCFNITSKCLRIVHNFTGLFIEFLILLILEFAYISISAIIKVIIKYYCIQCLNNQTINWKVWGYSKAETKMTFGAPPALSKSWENMAAFLSCRSTIPTERGGRLLI